VKQQTCWILALSTAEEAQGMESSKKVLNFKCRHFSDETILHVHNLNNSLCILFGLYKMHIVTMLETIKTNILTVEYL
jgi:hypothetical protein